MDSVEAGHRRGFYDDEEFLVPRIFYYLGMLFMCLTSIRPGSSVTLSDWFFVISLMLAGVEIAVSRRVEFLLPATLVAGLIILSAGAAVSTLASFDQQASLVALAKYLYLIGVWFWLGTLVLRNVQHIVRATTLWTVSACITGLGAVLQLLFGDVLPGSAPPEFGRMTGFNQHVNDLGGAAGIAIVPAMMLRALSSTAFSRILRWFVLLSVSVGVVLSVSLSGIGAAVASIAVWRLLTAKAWKNLLSLVAATGAGVILFTIFGRELSLFDRLLRISEEGADTSTLSSRVSTYDVAFSAVNSNPVVGAGVGQATETGYLVHNLFISAWFEAGIGGFIGMCLIVAAVSYVAWRLYRSGLPGFGRVAAALTSSFAALLILGLAQPVYYKRFGWAGAALLLALYAVRRRLAAPASTQPSTGIGVV